MLTNQKNIYVFLHWCCLSCLYSSTEKTHWNHVSRKKKIYSYKVFCLYTWGKEHEKYSCCPQEYLLLSAVYDAGCNGEYVHVYPKMIAKNNNTTFSPRMFGFHILTRITPMEVERLLAATAIIHTSWFINKQIIRSLNNLLTYFLTSCKKKKKKAKKNIPKINNHISQFDVDWYLKKTHIF